MYTEKDTRDGSNTELHFMILMWLLEGPERTYTELIEQFHITSHITPTRYLRSAIRLGLVKKVKRSYTWYYTPVRKLEP